MTFPAYLPVFGLRLHPHPVFESLGYFVGARWYFAFRRPGSTPRRFETATWLLIACTFGAWVGSKLLAWAEMPQHYWEIARHQPLDLLGGETIVGGLLGGWAAVEWAKGRLGVAESTGDDFVWPIALGTAIGRVGCFLTGLSDHTYGLPTSLPWGVDFGDGLARHPTQLYESGFVLVLAAGIQWLDRQGTWPRGGRFRCYMAGYFLFRCAIEFIKPRVEWLPGWSAIQLASLGGAMWAGYSICRLLRTRRALAPV